MKNPVGILERQEIPEFSEPDKILAKSTVEYVRDHLGYKHPDDVGITGGRLGQALRVAGIKPLTNESVIEYQAEMVGRCEPNLLCRFTARENSPVITLSLAAYAIFMIIYMLTVKVPVDRPLTQSFMSGIIFTTVFICWLMIVNIAGRNGRKTVEWKSHKLDGQYQKPIPKYVLDNVAEIHQRLPDAKFYIVELTFGTRELTKRVTDPFLLVTNDPERYYVDVWDEPDFMAKRKA